MLPNVIEERILGIHMIEFLMVTTYNSVQMASEEILKMPMV